VGLDHNDWIGGIASQLLDWWDLNRMNGLVGLDHNDWIGVI
jgi:hypothetical protein